MKKNPLTSSRASTVAHMHQMIAAATAAAACSHPEPQNTVTITPLPQSSTNDNGPTPPPPPTTVANPIPPPPPTTPDPSGYLVVDMMPAPARCLGVAALSKVAGKFHRDGSGFVLDLVVNIPSTVSGQSVSFNQVPAPSAWSGTIVSSSFRSNNTSAQVRLSVPAVMVGQASLGVSLSVTCGPSQTGSLAVNVTYANPASEHTVPSLTVHDY